MMGRKYGLIALLAVTALASMVYGAYEATPTIHRYSMTQFTGESFESLVGKSHLVAVGEIVNVGLQTVPNKVMGTDEDGTRYLVERIEKPHAAVTVRVLDVLKDDGLLNGEKLITFLDPEVDGKTGKIDGHPAIFHSRYAVDYKVGDNGLFLIHEDDGIYSMGFVAYYPITEGRDRITTDLDKLVGNSPLSLETTKNTARVLGQK